MTTDRLTAEMSPSNSGIVALAGDGAQAWIMINTLRQRFGDVPVIREQGEPDDVLWARRRRLLGAAKVASMKAANLPIKLMNRGAQKRIADLVASNGLDPNPPADRIYDVPTVNGDAARAALAALAPKVVFVVSTRMISKATREAVDAPFVNYHSGINPAYRGINGGYFALANGEPENFGSTVHLVDDGVDTGGILYQARVTPDERDAFYTYIWTMAAGSREIVVKAMEDALAGRLAPHEVNLPSHQYFAPTLGGYLMTGLKRGVW